MNIILLALFGGLIFFLLLPSFETKSLIRNPYPQAVFAKDSATGGTTFSWKDCTTADAKTRMSIVKVNINPNPIKRGQQVELDLELELHEQVSSGEVSVKLNYGVIPIVDENLDLCDLVTQINRQCPLKKGPFKIDIKETLPNYIPAGDYQGNANISDQDNKELVCLQLKATVQ